MFQVLVSLNELGTFESFNEAFKLFWKKIREVVREKGASYQWLETSNFIVLKKGDIEHPVGFYDAKDFAYEIGLLAGNGEIQENANEPDAVRTEAFFVLNSTISRLNWTTEVVTTVIRSVESEV